MSGNAVTTVTAWWPSASVLIAALANLGGFDTIFLNLAQVAVQSPYRRPRRRCRSLLSHDADSIPSTSTTTPASTNEQDYDDV
jgi:hypothetical protein